MMEDGDGGEIDQEIE